MHVNNELLTIQNVLYSVTIDKSIDGNENYTDILNLDRTAAGLLADDIIYSMTFITISSDTAE